MSVIDPSVALSPTVLSSEQWLDVLQDATLANADVLDILLAFYGADGHRGTTDYIQHLVSGEPREEATGAPIHGRISAFVQRVTKGVAYPIQLELRENGRPRYWSLPFRGEEVKDGRFEWILRRELVDALEQFQALTLVPPPPYPRPAGPPLNQILYGPPGTGKTYATVARAVAIANPAFPLEEAKRADVRAEYDRLLLGGRIVFTTFHQSLSYEDFVEGIKPATTESGDITYGVQAGLFRHLVRRARRGGQRGGGFVLIIDEINRGNVAAIFGELITLLEADKRLGAAESLTVTLPYSRERFGIPANLYLIGTMNTADRSVETLDAALRRRFTFVEVAPDPTVLTRVHPQQGIVEVAGRDIDLAQLLDLLNRRIATLLDDDHRLGHSYLLAATDWHELATALTDRVIPLLREYFYANYAQLQRIVGRGLCRSEPTEETDFAAADERAVEAGGRRRYFFPSVETEEELGEALRLLGV